MKRLILFGCLCVVFLFLGCNGDDDMLSIDSAFLEIETIGGLAADNCEITDNNVCQISCDDPSNCGVELIGSSQGLAGNNIVHTYVWVRGQDGIFCKYSTGISINEVDGDWTTTVSLNICEEPKIGSVYDIIVTASLDPISQTSTITFAGLGIEAQSNLVRIEVVGCFNPNAVSDFEITAIEGIAVAGNRVDSIDCSSVALGEACRITISGRSDGIYEQGECSYGVVLIEPMQANQWYFQEDVFEPNKNNGEWTTTIQLGDAFENDPRSEHFTLTAYVTSIHADSIPVSIPNTVLRNIFTSATSAEIQNKIEITVKH